jgi:hypothetical protein
MHPMIQTLFPNDSGLLCLYLSGHLPEGRGGETSEASYETTLEEIKMTML